MNEVIKQIDKQQISLIEKKLKDLYSQLGATESGRVMPTDEIKQRQKNLIFTYGVKFCPICKKVLPVSCFYGSVSSSGGGLGGYSTYCKKCSNKKSTEREDTIKQRYSLGKYKKQNESESVVGTSTWIYHCIEDPTIKTTVQFKSFINPPQRIGINKALLKCQGCFKSCMLVSDKGVPTSYSVCIFKKEKEIEKIGSIFKNAEDK